MEDFRRFLAARLAGQPNATEAHPEADLLTAFSEARLSSGERRRLLRHLAACVDCRDVVALASSSQHSEVAAKETGIRWWNLRWAAALATACVLGTVIWRTNSMPRAVQQTDVVIGAATVARRAPSAEAPKPATPKIDKGRVAITRTKVKEQVTSQAAVAPRLLPRAIVLPGLPPVERFSKADQTAPASRFEALLEATPHPPGAEAMAFQNSRNTLAKALPRPPRQLSLWSIDAGAGKLRKSDDGGQTWATVLVDSRTNFLALSVSGADIWVGGEGGALFRSRDNGSQWKEVPVANGEDRLNESITQIEAVDSQVKVRTKFGEWVSADDGVSWRKTGE